MLKDVLIIETNRDGYTIDQCGKTMTVKEMIDFLSQFDEDTEIYCSFDHRYTYGRITEGRIENEYVEVEDEDEG